jgi:hypothetical protein
VGGGAAGDGATGGGASGGGPTGGAGGDHDIVMADVDDVELLDDHLHGVQGHAAR